MAASDCATWTLTERPDRKRILLAVYPDQREKADVLRRQFGGRVRSIRQSEWLPTKSVPPTRIGQRLEIVHEGSRRTLCDAKYRETSRVSNSTHARNARATLYIPHGLAFGSGEHATTYMLLQALTGLTDLSNTTVLDLGTGSGVLALAARLFGATRIVATDFDPDAVGTARQNEMLNFSTPRIHWHCADVRKLDPKARYDLVLANLFSGILGEAAPQIAGSLSPGGQLWLSGILHSQHKEIVAAYRAQGLQRVRVNRRGKWLLLQWTAPIRKRPASRRTPPR
jgi:ribosomal protein L11 methyltransferase